jgi:hypothetical protein
MPRVSWKCLFSVSMRPYEKPCGGLVEDGLEGGREVLPIEKIRL